MLATLMTDGLAGAGDPHGMGAQRAGDPAATIACSSRSLSERSSCSPRWSSTAGSAERRVEPASATVWARRPSRRTSSSGEAADEGASPRPAAKTKQESEGARAARRGRRRRRASVAACTCDLAREHDLLEGAGADALDGARDRLLEVLGRRAEATARALGRVRVQQRQRALDEPDRRPLGALERAARPCRRARVRRRPSGARPRPGGRGRPRGRCSEAGGEAAPVRRRAAVVRRTRTPRGDQARAGAARRARRPRPREARSRQRRATSAKRSGPARLDRAHRAERGHGGAVAVGLLEAPVRLAGAPGRHHERARVRARRHPDGQRGERPAVAPRAPDRPLEAPEQHLPVAVRQDDAARAAARRDGHDPHGRAAARSAARPGRTAHHHRPHRP